MTVFKRGESVETREPTITVEDLREGAHRFQLEVANADGRLSAPDVVTVQVQNAPPPRDTRPA
jgi:hypothetical protein